MSTKGTNAPLAPTGQAAEEQAQRQPPQRMGEGMGVFRGLWFTLLLNLVLALFIWFAWHAFQHWRGH
jgi:hypothetical protein